MTDKRAVGAAQTYMEPFYKQAIVLTAVSIGQMRIRIDLRSVTLSGLILYNMDDVSRTFTFGLRISVTIVNFVLQIDNWEKSVD